VARHPRELRDSLATARQPAAYIWGQPPTFLLQVVKLYKGKGLKGKGKLPRRAQARSHERWRYYIL